MSILCVILSAWLVQGKVMLGTEGAVATARETVELATATEMKAAADGVAKDSADTTAAQARAIPGDYVMVYVPELKVGTLSDENGNYSLSIPGQGARTIEIEFSRIGYATVRGRYELKATNTADAAGHTTSTAGTATTPDQSATITLPTLTLSPQTLMLTAAIATPEGMSPAQYILSRVIKQTKAVKGNRLSYEADISYDFATHEIPLLATALSRGQVGMTKFAGTLMGIGPLVKYCLTNDDISAHATLHRSVVKGKAKDSDGRVVKSNPYPLPPKVQQNILDFFGNIDLFDLLYGTGGDMGKSFAKDHEFQLEGSYEYRDKLVHVLSWRARHMGVKLHVVDGEWAILKMQVLRSHGEVLRIEARDMGGGVYMPATFVMNPSFTHIRNEQIPELIRMVRENKQLKKAGKARMIALLEERYRNKEDFNPYVACGFSVRYTTGR